MKNTLNICIFELIFVIYIVIMCLNTKLRVEKSENCSGVVLNMTKIDTLKEKHYYVIPQHLDGDAPKEFIGAYFFYKDNGFRKSNVKSWPKYIAKTAEKWYPIESVTEYVINKLGEDLGLEMNNTELVVCNGQIRFLSKFFLEKNEILLHGAEICGDFLNDRDLAKEIAEDKLNARDLFTFEFICKALDKLFKSHSQKLKIEFVKMLVFDCLIGNNDRHFYNWGVITNTHRNVKNPIFAPLYDSARGLFWNTNDEQMIHFYNLFIKGESKKIENYSKKSEPRVSLENNKKANHFDLIKYIILNDEKYKEVVKELSSEDNEKKVLENFRKNLSKFFIKERQAIIEELLKYRFKTTRELTL